MCLLGKKCNRILCIARFFIGLNQGKCVVYLGGYKCKTIIQNRHIILLTSRKETKQRNKNILQRLEHLAHTRPRSPNNLYMCLQQLEHHTHDQGLLWPETNLYVCMQRLKHHTHKQQGLLETNLYVCLRIV